MFVRYHIKTIAHNNPYNDCISINLLGVNRISIVIDHITESVYYITCGPYLFDEYDGELMVASYTDKNLKINYYNANNTCINIHTTAVSYYKNTISKISWGYLNSIEYKCDRSGIECETSCESGSSHYDMTSDNYRYLYVNNKLVKIESLIR